MQSAFALARQFKIQNPNRGSRGLRRSTESRLRAQSAISNQQSAISNQRDIFAVFAPRLRAKLKIKN
jgi:hypothetical protein